eukprot:271119_1
MNFEISTSNCVVFILFLLVLNEPLFTITNYHFFWFNFLLMDLIVYYHLQVVSSNTIVSAGVDPMLPADKHCELNDVLFANDIHLHLLVIYWMIIHHYFLYIH